MQEINPTPEWKTSASLVCNVLPHCVRWLQQNNHKTSFIITIHTQSIVLKPMHYYYYYYYYYYYTTSI